MELVDGEGCRCGDPKAKTSQLGRQYDITADGRFLINTALNEATAPITLLQNWNPEAKK